MKTFFLLCLLLLSPLVFLAQEKTLTGLWTGALTNNDSVVRKDLDFELALTEYRGKIYGYSRRTFIVNDTLFYVVKRVKGKVNGDVAEVTDDEYIAYNFAGRVDKGVKITYTFRLNEKDSTWSLDGKWATNKVKKNFYSIDGGVELREEKNYGNSKLFGHLEELKLANDVAFYKEYKQPTAPVSNIAVAKKEEKKETPVAKPTKKEPVKDPPVTAKKTTEAPVIAAEEKTVVATTPAKPVAAAALAERKTIAAQTISFSSDSLQLALYDNGEIDGDTVSILLNGEMLLERQGLKAAAIKKTIYIQPGTDSIHLVLYAENLGKYPPNTGLLVVHDGEETYNIRFSADLQQNAAIIFRRRKK